MIPLIVGLLPLVPSIVSDVERLFGHGKGAAKKQAASAMISDGLNVFSQVVGVAGVNSNETALISQLIDVVVQYLNNTGAFSHGPQTT